MDARTLTAITVGLVSLGLTSCSNDGGGGGSQAPKASVARRIGSAADLIGGTRAQGRTGDWLLANDRIRVIVQDVDAERSIHGISQYGGTILDADLVRAAGEPGNDQFEELALMVNLESTLHPTAIEVVADGSDGGAATIRVTGTDDLLDSLNFSSQVAELGGGLVKLPSAYDDHDLPVSLATEYTLAPGSNVVEIRTTIRNDASGRKPPTLHVPVGDSLSGSGRLEAFVPGLGFGGNLTGELTLRGESDFVAFTGIDEGAGVSYGYAPAPLGGNSSVSASGLHIVLGGNRVLKLLLGLEDPQTAIPPGESALFVRYFVVGGSDIASVQGTLHSLLGARMGSVRGRVTVDGQPLTGARVAALATWGVPDQAKWNVVSSFETAADGTFSGTLPAERYVLEVDATGYPWDGSGAPTQHEIEVTDTATAEVEMALPSTGHLRVNVADGPTGTALPAKISVVGKDPSPPAIQKQNLPLLSNRAGLFRDATGDEIPHGLARVFNVDTSGDSGDVLLEPGRYRVVVSRGPEYSTHDEVIEVRAGNTTSVAAKLTRVVDTTGFVTADFHQHLINSFDSNISIPLRVRTLLAEGLEHAVATDHDFLTDFAPTVANLGVASWLSSGIGEEITSPDYGHFNSWPLTIETSRIDGGALDWGAGRNAAPGANFPSQGAFAMTPGEILANIRDNILDRDPDPEVAQINHINDSIGMFELLGVDTASLSTSVFTTAHPPAQFRLPGEPGTNFFDARFDALEVLIQSDADSVTRFLDQNFGDWTNLLNAGLVSTATGNSDTHVQWKTPVGAPRNFVAASTDSPGAVKAQEIAASVQAGRVVMSNAPFVSVRLVDTATGEAASLDFGKSRTVGAADGSVTLEIRVQSPTWAPYDQVAIYRNAAVTATDDDGDPSTPPYYAPIATRVRTAGADLNVNTVAVGGASRLESTLTERFDGLTEDSWFVVLVRGTPGVSAALFPVIPNDVDPSQPAEDLVTNPARGGVTALALTNPLFADVNANGTYDPPARVTRR